MTRIQRPPTHSVSSSYIDLRMNTILAALQRLGIKQARPAVYECFGCRCKTPGCTGLHVASLLGEVKEVEEGLEHSVPDWIAREWQFGCLECGSIHSYTPEDLKLGLTNHLPPTDWRPWF